MTPSEILRALIENPARTLRQLESVVGPMPYERSMPLSMVGHHSRSTPGETLAEVAAAFGRIDIYHQDPYKTLPDLRSFRVLVRDARADVEGMLRERFGAPLMHMNGATRVFAFGRFYLSEASADADLAWCESPPAFTRPIAEPFDPKKREAFLGSLREAVEALGSVRTADAFRHELVAGSGVVTERRHSTTRWALLFVPPVLASEIIAAFGWREMVSVATDVHQSAWTIYDARSAHPVTSGWRIECQLQGRPEGELPKGSWGASPRYDLAHHAAKVSRIFFHSVGADADDRPTTELDDRLPEEHPYHEPTPFPTFGCGSPPAMPSTSGPSPFSSGPVLRPPPPIDALVIDPAEGFSGIVPGRSRVHDVLGAWGSDAAIYRYDDGRVYSVSYDYTAEGVHEPDRPANQARPNAISFDDEIVSRISFGVYQTLVRLEGGLNTQCSHETDMIRELGPPRRDAGPGPLVRCFYPEKGIECLLDGDGMVIALYLVVVS